MLLPSREEVAVIQGPAAVPATSSPVEVPRLLVSSATSPYILPHLLPSRGLGVLHGTASKLPSAKRSRLPLLPRPDPCDYYIGIFPCAQPVQLTSLHQHQTHPTAHCNLRPRLTEQLQNTTNSMAAFEELSGRIQSPLLLLFAALIMYQAALSYRSWNRLRHIPGPLGAAFTKWWMLRNTLGGQMHLALKRACDDYGEAALEPPPPRFAPRPLSSNRSLPGSRRWGRSQTHMRNHPRRHQGDPYSVSTGC